MESLIYIVLGTFDSLACLILMFKIFRFPIKWFWKQFLIIALVGSIISYLDRIVFEIPQYDMIVQFALYIILLRKLVRVRVYESSFLVSIGYLSFALISSLVYTFLVSINFMNVSEASSTNALSIYMIQISSQVISILVAYILFVTRKGFSSIIVPPHEMSISVSLSPLKVFTMITVILSAILLFLLNYWIISFHFSLAIGIPTILITLSILVFLSYKKEFQMY